MVLRMTVQPPDLPPTRSKTYNAFLLRCWFRDGDWRFALEDVQTQRRQGFETAEAMMASLHKRLQQRAESQGE